MSEKKSNNNLDDLLREKFASEKQMPSSLLWDNINKQAQASDQKERKQGLAFLKYALFFLLLLITASLSYFPVKTPKQELNKLVQKETDSPKTNKSTLIKNNQRPPNSANFIARHQPAVLTLPSIDKSTIKGESPPFTSTREWVSADKILLFSPPIKAKTNTPEKSEIPLIDIEKNDFPIYSKMVALNISPITQIPLKTSISSTERSVKKPEILVKRAHKYQLTLTPFLSSNYSNQFFSDNQDHYDDEFNSQHFNEEENGKLNLGYGIKASLYLKPGFTISSGLGLRNHSTIYDASDVHVIHDSLDGFFRFNTSYGEVDLNEHEFEGEENNNNEDENEDEIHFEDGDISIDYKSVQNKTYLTIPLSMEVYFLKKNRLSFYSGLGISLDLLMSQSIKLNVKDLGQIQKSSTNSNRRINMSGLAYCGLEYALTKRISLNFEPNFRLSFLSLNSNNSVYAYPYSIGLDSGLRYKF